MHTTLFDDVACSDWSNVDFHALETCHAHPVRTSGRMTWRGQVLATGLMEFVLGGCVKLLFLRVFLSCFFSFSFCPNLFPSFCG
jgi:hypothetical protein